MHSILWGMLVLFVQAPQAQQVDTAFLEGQPVPLRFSQPSRRERQYMLGPWKLGPRLRYPSAGKPDRPHDQRLNIYIVLPGAQYQSEQEEFDHNFVINALPRRDREAEYDVFWALQLDPDLQADFRSENDLLLAAQEKFQPNDLFEFPDIPTNRLLESELKLRSLPELKKYRNKDGTLPRVLIIPAGFALRAAAAVM